jgi:hypothetical protein
MKSKLPTFVWGHAILHIASLVRIRSSVYHKYSPLQLVFGISPNIFHLWTFSYTVYVPITPLQRTKMGPQRKMWVYVGFDSLYIIRFFEPLINDVFKACFEHYHLCRFWFSVRLVIGVLVSFKTNNNSFYLLFYQTLMHWFIYYELFMICLWSCWFICVKWCVLHWFSHVKWFVLRYQS